MIKRPNEPAQCNYYADKIGEMIESSGGPCYLSTILLKNFHLFKIAESIIGFY